MKFTIKDPRYFTLSRLYVRKFLLYAPAAFLLAILETSTLAPLAPLGVTPDILLPFVIAIGFFDGRQIGAVTGIAVGFLIDALGSAGLSLMPLVYFMMGYVCGICAGRILSKNYPSFMIYTMTAALARGAVTLVYLGSTVDQLNDPGALVLLFLSEFAAISLFATPLYFLGKGLHALSERTPHA